MTREERVFIDFKDLYEIEIACKHGSCKARVTCSLTEGLNENGVPTKCPVCNKEWFHFSGNDAYKQSLLLFSKVITILRDSQGGKDFAVKVGLHATSVQQEPR